MKARFDQTAPLPKEYCQHGNLRPCDLCLEEKLKIRPELKLPEPQKETLEPYEQRMESGDLDTPLVGIGWATVSSEKHPDRNEDAIGLYPEEEIYAVFDGMGGHAAGDAASRFARDNLLKTYRASRAQIQKLDKTQQAMLWQSVLEGNSYVMAKEAEINPRWSQIFHRDLKEARQQMDGAPEEVKREAMTVYHCLQELSEQLKIEGNKDKNTKGMGTTAAGGKFMKTTDGRHWAIIWSVGDSEAWLENFQTGEIERAVKSDNGLAVILGRGQGIDDFSEERQQQLRHQITIQALAQPQGKPHPRIRIQEMTPGTRLAFFTDGIGDNDQEEEFKLSLRSRRLEPWSEVSRQMIRQAVWQMADRQSKGWDDVGVINLEIK